VDAVPVISRGHNVAVLLPPVPEAVRPLLAAVTARLIVLTPDADRAVQVAAALAPAFAASGGRVVAVTGHKRGTHLLAGEPQVACVAVLDALALLRASALPLRGYAAIALAWPEALDTDAAAALEAVMAEAERDAQRIIITADAGSTAQHLIERYAFKAMTFGFPPTEPSEDAPPAPSGPVGAARYVVAPARQFEDARRRALDALAPDRDEAVIVAPPPVSRDAALALVRVAGDTAPVIVAEPWQLGWLRALFAPLTPLPVATAADAEERKVDAERARLTRLAEADDLGPELMVLAPLLTRFDAAVVAAAALRLARTTRRGTPVESGPAPAAPSGAVAKLWVGIGRKDNVRPGDLVGALANQAKVPADAVGKIEVRDLFCLVEIRADQAERAAKGLTGMVVKGRRLVARVDRGPGAGAHRPPRRV